MSLVASTNDKLDILPVDPSQQPTFNERKIIDTIFPLAEMKEEKKDEDKKDSKKDEDKKDSKKDEDKKEEKKDNNKLIIKHITIASLLFLLFQLPYIDTLILKILPSEKIYYKLALKTFLFISIYFIIAQIFLSCE